MGHISTTAHSNLMNEALLESQEGVLYFITLALSDISTLASSASQSAHNSQTLQGFLNPL